MQNPPEVSDEVGCQVGGQAQADAAELHRLQDGGGGAGAGGVRGGGGGGAGGGRGAADRQRDGERHHCVQILRDRAAGGNHPAQGGHV